MTLTLFDEPIESESKTAGFSSCRTYRYVLTRCWADGELAVFIGLNPSTADEERDDPTIRRCKGFAKAWGCGGLLMLNLFAYRSTDPIALWRAADPIGPNNDVYLRAQTATHRIVVAAWGSHGDYLGRDRQVRRMIPQLRCLGTTRSGQPRHPLYLPKSAELRTL